MRQLDNQNPTVHGGSIKNYQKVLSEIFDARKFHPGEKNKEFAGFYDEFGHKVGRETVGGKESVGVKIGGEELGELSGTWLVHNHPGGLPLPSIEDLTSFIDIIERADLRGLKVVGTDRVGSFGILDKDKLLKLNVKQVYNDDPEKYVGNLNKYFEVDFIER